MSYFSQAWKDAASDRWGEAPHLRLSVRTAEQTPQVVVLTDTEEIIDFNPIKRERERKFGVIQGQSWQVQLTNDTLAAINLALKGGWAQVEVGFPTANEWAVMAVGRIQEVTATTDSLVTIEVGDPLVDLQESRITRDIYFRNTAWAGGILDMSRSETSKGYDNDAVGAGVEPFGSWTNLILDETFVIEFTSATAFKVVLENGTETQTGTIAADLDVFGTSVPVPNFERLRINKEGWSTDANAYAAGDKFVFYTSKARSDSELGAMAMVNKLLFDVADLQVYDFASGTMVSASFSPQTWIAAASTTDGDKFGGFWARGSKVVDMVQGVLLVVHASIYPMPNGKVHFWMLEPSTEVGAVLNGDPDFGPVSILNGSRGGGLKETYNHIIYRYKNLVDGTEAVAERIDSGTIFDADLVLDRDIKWECRALSVEAGADRALVRFKNPPEIYSLESTFDGAAADIGELSQITEPALGLSQKQANIVAVETDSMNDRAVITATVEAITLQDYFVFGDATTDPEGSKIGGSGDPGAGKIW